MRTLNLAIVGWLLLSVASAQSGCSWLKLDGATATAVGVLWSHGFDDDAASEAGLARVLAACRLERARSAVPNLLASGMHIGGDYSLAFAVVAGGEQARAAAFVAALLDDSEGAAGQEVLTDDCIALRVARGALAADDAEFLYPGNVLLRRARERLGYGTALARPPAGIARAMQKLTPEAVRAALRRPEAVRIAALGVVDAEMIAAIGKLAPADAVAPPREQLLCSSPQVKRDMTEDLNTRADSPYVCAAFALPKAVDRAALALGLEVATSRAFRQWRMRGEESRARAPFVNWSWLHGDAIIQFCRRGEDPAQLLPGQQPDATAKDEMRATQAELKSFLEDLRTIPPTEQEIGAAREALRLRLQLPGPGESPAWAREPATLPGRLQVLLLATHHAVDVAVVNTLTISAVHDALRLVLPADAASWHALLPAPSSRAGFRRR